MQLYKKLVKGICLVLIIAMLIPLAACGKKPTDNDIVEVPDDQVEIPVIPETIAVTGVTVSLSAFTFETTDAGIQLTATVMPSDASNQDIIWTSGNLKIASVDSNGYVTAVNNGVTDITAKTVDGGFTAVCTVTVTLPEPEPVLVTSITLDMEEVTLYIDDSVASVATVLPEDATDKILTWVSSDPEIATVDEFGVITAIAKGSAKITASSSNGISAVVSVTVKKKTTTSTPSTGGDSSSSSSTASKLSFGSNPSYPAAKLDSNGFLSSDILSEYNAYNSDIVAWLYLPGTNINFPVAQTSNKNYYLDYGLDKKKKATGSCYIDDRDDAVSVLGQLLNHNNIFYGHAKGTDIFDQLENVTRSKDWFNVKSNRYIYVNTLKYRYVFEIFATYYMDTTTNSVIQNVNFSLDENQIRTYLTELFSDPEKNADEITLATTGDLKYKLTKMKNTEAFTSFCANWKDRVDTSYSENGVNYGYLKDRDFGVTVDADDVIVTLYTCADAGDIMKYIVQASLVKSEAR